uniref:Uncharacterized protein n=1 Tax=Odontella aurita TaxID=265563 RepID=A0A7S4HXR6_9STRA|mmetsp:Transcript_16738/g.48140  ORF Transcript_16738/g.48140 Transcript_16738/m.48140 type:complete len:113 (+) Transcript_16738:1631-1969(+)
MDMAEMRVIYVSLLVSRERKKMTRGQNTRMLSSSLPPDDVESEKRTFQPGRGPSSACGARQWGRNIYYGDAETLMHGWIILCGGAWGGAGSLCASACYVSLLCICSMRLLYS